MLNPKSYKVYLAILIVLSILSAGMFSYQYFFYNKELAAKREIIYVLNQDVNAHTQLTLSMLKPVEIYKDSILEGMVTPETVQSLDGQYFAHGVKTNELLNPAQLSSANLVDEGDLVIPIQAGIVSDVIYGDNVGFYVLRNVPVSEGSDETRTIIERVFDTKKLYGKGDTGQAETVTVNVADESIQFYIKVTEPEMELYYRAISSGTLILAKQLTEVDKNMDVESNIAYFDPESTRVNYDASITKGNGYDALGEPDLTDGTEAETDEEADADGTNTNQVTTVKYTVEATDTFESIATKFKTNTQVINALNPDIIALEQGVELLVPAQ